MSDPITLDENGKPHWTGSREQLLTEMARVEGRRDSLSRQMEALDALIGDYIELVLLEIPESPAMAITKVMMEWGIDPTQMDYYRTQGNRRGFVWRR